MRLLLNGFQVTFSAAEFSLWAQDVPDPSAIRGLRGQFPDWFLHWETGRLYGLPRDGTPTTEFGQPLVGKCDDHEMLRLLTARIGDQLPKTFPQYKAFRRRPFSFLGRKDELVERALRDWSNVPPLVRRFTIRPRFDFEPRIVELRDGDTKVGLFLRVSLAWRTDAPLDELAAVGVDLTGLHVIHQTPAPGQRRLLGCISRLYNGSVELSESFSGQLSVPSASVYLEGSRAAFSRCLKTLLGPRFATFEERRGTEEEKFLTGPAVNELLNKMRKILQKASPIELAADLSCNVGGLIEPTNSSEYASVFSPKPVEYCFDPSKSKRSRYAWPGLEKYGPYGSDTFSAKTPRILVVCPDSAEGQAGQFLKKLRDGIQSLPDSNYATGVTRTFHLLNPAFESCTVRLSQTSEPPAALYRRTIQDSLARATAGYDAALVVVLDQHAALPDAENPYLWGKADLLMAGIPVQDVRASTMSRPDSSLQYVLQNIAVALYAKMGGVPWTVDHPLTVNDELVIGIGSAELSGSRFEPRQRFMGIATVFRGDGNYLLSHISQECSYDDYPAMLRESTSRVLNEVKARNGWAQGDTVRVVVHSSKPLKKIEVADLVGRCVHEVGSDQTVQFAFVTVSQDHPFSLLDLNQKGYGRQNKGVYAPARGVIGQLGRFTRLVCTNGPELMKRAGSPLPTPLLVHLHQQSDYRDQTYLAEQVLKFTSLSWRSTLPAREPVTIYYPRLIAEMLARLKAVPGWSPEVLNSRLRASKWFL